MASKSTLRERVLLALARQGSMSARDLARRLRHKAITIRYHLESLQAEGLIAHRLQTHGVGRPRFLYSLKPAAHARFHSQTNHLVVKLLDHLKQQPHPTHLATVVHGIGKSMAAEHEAVLAQCTADERAAAVTRLLWKEGFDSECEPTASGYQFTQLSCPYYRVGLVHPEICEIDRGLISAAMTATAVQTSSILEGSAKCTFVVDTAPTTRRVRTSPRP